jgi:hypothetical protein
MGTLVHNFQRNDNRVGKVKRLAAQAAPVGIRFNKQETARKITSIDTLAWEKLFLPLHEACS